MSREFQIACLLAAAAFLSGCQKEKAKDAEHETATPVTVEKAVRGAIDRVIATDAVLWPVDQANVTAKISAPVKRVLVNRGEHVKAGQLLIELESADLASATTEAEHQYEQTQAAYQTLTGATVFEDKTKAQADLQTAQQTLEAAKRVYENRVALVKEGALAQKIADDAKVAMVAAQSAFDTAQRHLEALNRVSQREAIRGLEAQMKAAKAHHESAAVQLSYAQIRSPIDGIVADRPVYPGEMAATGAPLISIINISQVVARANIPAKDSGAIKMGCAARIAGPDGDIPGTVTVVSPAVDPGTTTVEVWVRAANPGLRLVAGGTVRVSIIAETIRDAIVAPASALLNTDDGGQKVMVITSDNVAHERRINAGIRQDARVQILSGLQEGDQVVVSGGLGLEDKAKVRLVEPKAEEEEEEPAAHEDKKGEPKKDDKK